MAKVFFTRCKPWGFDAVDVALNNRVVFFGYPLIDRENYDGTHLKSCMADPSGDTAQWLAALERETPNYRKQANRNRNMVDTVLPGDVVIIPRPSRGTAYCAHISDMGFELVDSPQWAPEFQQLILNGDDRFHETEVAQCWHVEPFVSIYLPRLPAWIRRSLFGRSTYGYVHGVEGQNPHATMSRLMSGEGRAETRLWSTDLPEVEGRLLADMSPTSFEYLMTAILQLEHPCESWQNVGGSGDDGIDGIASTTTGAVSALLQCKWQYWNEPIDLGQRWNAPERQPRVLLAALHHPAEIRQDLNAEFIGRRRVAELVVKHSDRLPQAIAMRIGQG